MVFKKLLNNVIIHCCLFSSICGKTSFLIFIRRFCQESKESICWIPRCLAFSIGNEWTVVRNDPNCWAIVNSSSFEKLLLILFVNWTPGIKLTSDGVRYLFWVIPGKYSLFKIERYGIPGNLSWPVTFPFHCSIPFSKSMPPLLFVDENQNEPSRTYNTFTLVHLKNSINPKYPFLLPFFIISLNA